MFIICFILTILQEDKFMRKTNEKIVARNKQ